MIRKLLALTLCLLSALTLTAPALAEIALPELTPMELSSGVILPVPANYYVLAVGMMEDDNEALVLMDLTVEEAEALLRAQGIQADLIAPDIGHEFLFSATPYAFTDFADLTDEVLSLAFPSLEQALAATGITIVSSEIVRWEGSAFIVMEQYQDYGGATCPRLHAYTVQDGYAINVILMVYSGEITESHAALLASILAGIQMPE